MGKGNEILNRIKIKKLEYLGHVMREEKYVLLQEKKGKSNRGRGHISWIST